MLCKNCGARLSESARRCPRCGRPVAAGRAASGKTPSARPSSAANSRPAASSGPATSGRQAVPGRQAASGRQTTSVRSFSRPTQKKSGSRLGLALALGTVAVLAVAICVAVFSGGSETPEYAQVLDRYFAALTARDAEGYASTRPDAYIAYLTREDGSYLNRTMYINELTGTIDERMNGYAAACGSNLRITYNISQALDMSPYVPRINSVLASWYGFPADSVESAVLVTGSYTVRGNSDSQQVAIDETLLLEIGGQWYFSPDIGQSWRN